MVHFELWRRRRDFEVRDFGFVTRVWAYFFSAGSFQFCFISRSLGVATVLRYHDLSMRFRCVAGVRGGHAVDTLLVV